MFQTEKVKQHYRTRNGKKFLVNPFNRQGRKKENNQGSLLKKVLLGIGIVGLTATVGTLAFKKQYSKLHPDSKKYVDLALNSPREVLEAYLLKPKYKLGSKSKSFNFESLSLEIPKPKANFEYKDLTNLQVSIKDKWDSNLTKLAENLKNGNLEDVPPQPTWIKNNFLRNPQIPIRSVFVKDPNKTKVLTFSIGGRTPNLFGVIDIGTSKRLKQKIIPNVTESTNISSFGTWANNPYYAKKGKSKYQPYLDVYEKGYDPTTLETAITAYKSWKKYPDKKLVITGHSSGAWMANDAAIILERAGVPRDKLQVITTGGERTLNSPEYSNAMHLLDNSDHLAKKETLFSNLTESDIDWDTPNIKKYWQDFPEGKGHMTSVYLNENKEQIRNFVNPTPKKVVEKKQPKSRETLKQQFNTELEDLNLKLKNLEENLKNETNENKKRGMLKGKEGMQKRIEALKNKISNYTQGKNMYYLADFARPLGAKDKEPRERKKNKLLADARTIGDKAIYGAGAGFAGVGMLPFRSAKVEDALQSKHMNKIPVLGRRYRKMAQDITPKQFVGGNRVGRYLAENLPAQSVAGAGLGLLGAGYGAYKVLQNRRKNRYD